MYLLSRDDTKITLCFNDLHGNGKVMDRMFEEHSAGHHEKLKRWYFLPVTRVQGVFSVFI